MNNSRHITEFIFREDSYEINASDGSGASISQTGLVTIDPGASVPEVCLRPENVVGFESDIDSGANGRFVYISFVTDAGEKHRWFLGATAKVSQAESWVTQVNSLYPGSNVLAFGGNREIAKRAPQSGTPFIDEVLDSGRLSFMPGIYGNMIRRPGAYARPKPYEPVWLRNYSARVLSNLREVTGHNRDIELQDVGPASLDTSSLKWSLDVLRPRSQRKNRSPDLPRAVLSGEFLFEHPIERPNLKVLKLMEATRFALVMRDGSRFVTKLLPRNGTAKERLLADWLIAMTDCQKGSAKIPIVTLEGEVADIHLLDTSLALPSEVRTRIERYHAGSIEQMAEILHRFRTDNAIAVADIGGANELIMYYSYLYGRIRKDFIPISVPYTSPVSVGLGAPQEDALWVEICAQSLNETTTGTSSENRTSLAKTKKRFERYFGMRWAA